MKKYILKFFVFSFLSIIFQFWFLNVNAASIPIEEVFSDIDTDYQYYNQLQYMFDNWVISPDKDWKFNPKQLLNRDEFVWIVMKVSCEECISPEVSYDLIQKYWEQDELFYDVNKNNKYFYCIASAKDSWYVKWYDAWTACENWDVLSWEAPFCPENTIILEEALAVVMRASWILSNYEAELVRWKIYSWEITQNLSSDVFPKNPDWSVYSFYPDFQKALTYEVIDYDLYGNAQSSKLINSSEYLRPKQAITKEKFLQIAYVALKGNSCIDRVDSNLWLQMNIYDMQCNPNSTNCDLSDLNWEDKVYDFDADVAITWNDSISTDEQYIWRFYNYNTWEEIKRYWKYIDNYDFLNDWKYRVYLRVISDNWNTWEVYNDINIWDWNNSIDTQVSIHADSIYWVDTLLVNFEAIATNDNIVSYTWDFWDWQSWFWKNPSNVYTSPWVYEVLLTTVDNWWNINTATVLIYVWTEDDQQYNCSLQDINQWLYWCEEGDLWVYSIDKENELSDDSNDDNQNNWIDDVTDTPLVDSDWDWIYNKDDLCPLIPWENANEWCPIFDQVCEINSDCWDWYTCNSWYCKPVEYAVTCEYAGWDLIYWNVSCNSCPCNNLIDFNTVIRECDIVFPAITSPDQRTIYSKWNNYEIRK